MLQVLLEILARIFKIFNHHLENYSLTLQKLRNDHEIK